MSKIIVLSGSVRKGGNTELLVHSFFEGAKQNNEVEIISVRDYQVKPCTGCNFCRKNDGNQCCQKDDMEIIYEKLKTADILVIASPVYFYGISAQLKAVVDRFHSPIRKTFPIKQLALLAVAADTLPEVFDSILMQYQLTLDYFHLYDAGKVLVRGVAEKGAIADREDALTQAYRFGESLS